MCRGLEQRPKPVVVEIGLTGTRKQQRANVMQLSDAAFQLLGGGVWVGGGQRGERREAVGSGLRDNSALAD
jgi:hypothetical protein